MNGFKDVLEGKMLLLEATVRELGALFRDPSRFRVVVRSISTTGLRETKSFSLYIISFSLTWMVILLQVKVKLKVHEWTSSVVTKAQYLKTSD